MIIFNNVTKVYANAEKPALHQVNLRIQRGEFVFVVGASGAGKSTLARLIHREEKPTSGFVVVDGRNLGQMPEREVPYLRRNIGIIFQDFKLLNERTVWENVAFALEVTEAPPKEIKRRVPAALDLVGLKDKMSALPLQLSGGEQQRVAVARAIVRSPALIVADEPTGNLDPENSWAIMNLLVEINRMGATVVVATHARSIVNALRRRVVALVDGRVVRDEERGAYGDEL